MDYSTHPLSYSQFDEKYYLQQAQFVTHESLALQTAEVYTYPHAFAQQGDADPAPPYYHNAPYHIYDYHPQPHAHEHSMHVEQSPEAPTASADHSVHIYAPIPISAYSTLLPSIQPQERTRTPRPAEYSAANEFGQTSQPNVTDTSPPLAEESKPYNPVDCYANMQQSTFPTPCELLTELAANERSAQRASAAPAPLLVQPNSAPGAASLEEIRVSPGPESSMGSSSPGVASSPLSDADGADSRRARRRSKALSKKRPVNQRKARFRAIAENIGFKSTDPDTITSHDKKRHYLECIEHYVLWLHEQIRLVGADPVQLERVPDYTGPNNRSLRTLLVHMQNECRTLRHEVVNEERLFMELEQQVLEQEAQDSEPACAEQEQPSVANPNLVPATRRHSIASGMIPLLAATYNEAPHGQPGLNPEFTVPT